MKSRIKEFLQNVSNLVNGAEFHMFGIVLIIYVLMFLLIFGAPRG